MADQNETPAPVPETVNPAQVKQMLGLPDAATDAELVAALVQLVAALQEKYDALLGDSLAKDEAVANADLKDFQDVITNDTAEFWREQLLTNRGQALNILSNLRQSRQAATPPNSGLPQVSGFKSQVSDAPAPLPLRNRLVAPRTMQELAEETPEQDHARAMRIRNRAAEIRKNENIPYIAAFRRAAQEIQ